MGGSRSSASNTSLRYSRTSFTRRSFFGSHASWSTKKLLMCLERWLKACSNSSYAQGPQYKFSQPQGIPNMFSSIIHHFTSHWISSGAPEAFSTAFTNRTEKLPGPYSSLTRKEHKNVFRPRVFDSIHFLLGMFNVGMVNTEGPTVYKSAFLLQFPWNIQTHKDI